jgi:lysophospholipase L1-like esterase
MSVKKFFVRFFILIILLVVVDFFVGNLLRHFYFKQKAGVYYRTTMAVDSVKSPMLFFGSSRCSHHYNPEIFNKIDSTESYNTGKDGNGLPYYYSVLKAVLKRYSPKIIILDVHINDLEYDPKFFDKISCLLPYYKSHPEIRDIIDKRGTYEKIKMLSATYPFNSMAFSIAAGQSGKKRTMEDINGYIPLHNKRLHGPLLKYDIKSTALDSTYADLLKRFITDCKAKNVRLVIAISPYYKILPSNKVTIVKAKQLADEYGIPFLNYSQRQEFLSRPDFFSDPSHLNADGANLYSTLVSKQIIDILSNNKKANP